MKFQGNTEPFCGFGAAIAHGEIGILSPGVFSVSAKVMPVDSGEK